MMGICMIVIPLPGIDGILRLGLVAVLKVMVAIPQQPGAGQIDPKSQQGNGNGLVEVNGRG